MKKSQSHATNKLMRNHFENIKMPKDTSNNKNSYGFDTQPRWQQQQQQHQANKQTHTKQCWKFAICVNKCCLCLPLWLVSNATENGLWVLIPNSPFQQSNWIPNSNVWNCVFQMKFATTEGSIRLVFIPRCWSIAQSIHLAVKNEIHLNLFL